MASIIFVVHGQCKINEPTELNLSAGKVFMVPANIIIKIYVGFEMIELYQAFINV